VHERIEKASGESVHDAASLKRAVGALVERFGGHGALSAAISLTPQFEALPVEDRLYDSCVRRALSGAELDGPETCALRSGTLFAVAEGCRQCGLPLQIMYGALRDAYPHGVHQGRDLPQAGDTLSGLLPLLNAFPDVTFCLSVLSDDQTHELNSYGWLLQNVVLSGHWWYPNIPAYIAPDLAARIQSVPKTKLIGYYSDMYKLEFGLAKFNMYRRVLARVLARDIVQPGFATERDALRIARLLLRDNPMRIFGMRGEAQ